MSDTARAAIITVGVGPSCDFDRIQAALNEAIMLGGMQEIRVSRTQNYVRQNLFLKPSIDPILPRSKIILIGGFDHCEDTEPSDRITLSGSCPGNCAGLPIVRFEGSGDLRLENLEITEANQTADGDKSGGIDFVGQGDLQIVNTVISSNIANGNGGGIRFIGDGGPASLNLVRDVVLSGNTSMKNGGGFFVEGNAQSPVALNLGDRIFVNGNRTDSSIGQDGGGGYVVGNVYLRMMGRENSFVRNSANTLGGGMFLGAGVTAEVGATPVNGPNGFTFNANELRTNFTSSASISATNYATSRNGALLTGPVKLRLFSIDGTQHLRIGFNKGGALSADGRFGVGLVDACIENIEISDNTEFGLMEAYGNAMIRVNSPECDFPIEADRQCSQIHCNAFHDNKVNPSLSVFRAADGGIIDFNRVKIHHNSIITLRSVFDVYRGGKLRIRNSIILEGLNSTIANGVIRVVDQSSSLEIEDSTLKSTLTGESVVPFIKAGGGTSITSQSTLFDTPFQRLFGFETDTNFSFNHVLVPLRESVRASPLGQSGIILFGAPEYLVGTDLDFRLGPNSLGVDVAPNRGGTDVGHRPRDVNIDGLGSATEVRDIGAYETQLIELQLFENGFE